MSRLLLVAAVWLSTAHAAAVVPAMMEPLLGKLRKGITNDIATIAEPIEKALFAIGFSQCSEVKKLLGVDYATFRNRMEPDLNGLSLVFTTRSVDIKYKLRDAARLILQSEWFDPSKPLKIYLHGFFDDPSQDGFTKLSKAFLDAGDVNILALDASSLLGWQYLRATTMVQLVGEQLGKLLASFVKAGLRRSNIHLIGHSLGSHISGFAGKTFKNLTKHRVGRITGLDPAGPCFSNVDLTLRLNKKDARFVDVIHTDAGVYGIAERVGHVDYFPNGGSKQPSCPPTHLLDSCSHSRAWLLFAESVTKPDAFLGVACPDWDAFQNQRCNYTDLSPMGLASRPGTRGTYYLSTAEEPPYGLGDGGTRFVKSPGVLRFFMDVFSVFTRNP
ncbi:pancreatic lipase-related protein 2 isoform X1 [Spodoptera frugiperda]|uniref:Pancreatic lipase-related protein 2 isoform X1 n=2 Tax=Spodoptera frugiperda TaxID=7108 RepID=A0A9R0DSD7_SPOFR|nr:pancreatic lipase-related protein 2 isoform X1 [Spodoptera frugiperda]XP_050552300.1 pancreatic lipase-related protein 2 isoform X1 [Spodoptera frugiperda]XP_050552301.1 pancreatic lipase-related protein 2 isoform X1 [Spodoptera frugiperda]